VLRLVLLFAAATLAALALQTMLPYWLPLGPFVPDLVLILAVDLGMRHHSAIAALMAFLMGYAIDAFSGTQIGLNAFMVTLVFLLAYELSSTLLVTNVLVGMLAVFVGVLIKVLGSMVISSGFSGLAGNPALMRTLMGQAAVSALLAPLVFALMARGKKVIGLLTTGRREDNTSDRRWLT
jgi:rod shape-determining protein MreD